MNFNVGEIVSFLYEEGEGKIINIISSSEVLLIDNFGFEQKYKTNLLVKKMDTNILYDLNITIKDNENNKKLESTHQVIKSKTKEKDFWELDLHIEQLLDSYKGLTNFEILSLQMRTFKSFLSKARSNNISKLVVIHGVGEGVLKNEIRDYLATQEFLEFFDASYLEYGKGATEIKLRFHA